MLYGKIKTNYDGQPVYKVYKTELGNTYKSLKPSFYCVSNELYTMKEIEKYSIPESYYDVVNYPKNKSYWFFGCRFNDDQKYIFDEKTGEKIYLN